MPAEAHAGKWVLATRVLMLSVQVSQVWQLSFCRNESASKGSGNESMGGGGGGGGGGACQDGVSWQAFCKLP